MSMKPPAGRIFTFGLALLGGFHAGLLAAASEFRAGAAKVCITRALGITINGGVGSTTARPIHDDLFVRALVLDGYDRDLMWQRGAGKP